MVLRSATTSGRGWATLAFAVVLVLTACSSSEDRSEEGFTEMDPGSGTLVASSGFDVRRDGFSFPNWGPPTAEHGRGLTPASMQSLFGDAVCAPGTESAQCVLSPMGRVTSEVFENGMNGGHCFGMAAVAGLAYRNSIDTSSFVAPGATLFDARPSPATDAVIARYFNTQEVEPTADSEMSEPVDEVIDRLTSAWAEGQDHLLAFYTEDGTSGHAVTPIAIRDLGDSKRGIVIYDNNYPGVEKMIVTDPAADTWYYTTSADPADDSYLFSGTPDNQLKLFPLAEMTGVHRCPSCTEVGEPGQDYLVLVTDDTNDPVDATDVEWSLSVSDTDRVRRSAFINNDNTALLETSTDTPMRLTLSDVADNDRDASIDISILSDGWVVRSTSLRLPAGASIVAEVSPTERSLTLTTDAPTTSDYTVAIEDARGSRSAFVSTIDLPVGGNLVVAPTDTDTLRLSDGAGQVLREVAMT